MARIKSPAKKAVLIKAGNERKRAPVWVYARTARKVRDGPRSHRNWKRSTVF